MSEKKTSNLANPTNLIRCMCRQSRRPTAQPRMRLHLWLACAAALALCLAGCPTQDAAESRPEQDPSDESLFDSELLVPPQDAGASTSPSADASAGESPTGARQLKITSIKPAQGPAEGGTRVTIVGSGFVDGATVFFGDAAASSIVVLNGGMMTATTPAHDPGDAIVSIHLSDGSQTSAQLLPFVYWLGDCPDYDPSIDTDGDGLADGLETCGWRIAIDLYGFGTDHPSGLHYKRTHSDPNEPDTDGDGLTDYEEYLLGSDLRDQDTDKDGLKDAEEVNRWLTSPVSVDSDGDANGDNDALPPNASLFDGAELKIDFENDPNHTPAIDATSPIMADTDGDGRSDYEELDHAVLSPVIADLPALELEVVDEIDVLLNVEYAEEAGTSTEYGTSFSRATSTSEHWYTGGSMEVGTGLSVMVGAEAEVSFPKSAS